MRSCLVSYSKQIAHGRGGIEIRSSDPFAFPIVPARRSAASFHSARVGKEARPIENPRELRHVFGATPRY